MLLRDRLHLDGAFLFRWRSFLPFILIPPALLAATQAGYFERWFGEQAEAIWDFACLGISFAGLAIRIATVGFVPGRTSGRNTREQRADVLNTTGLYSVVRNPLYLGNLVIFAGYVLTVKVWWLGFLALLVFSLYYERIIYTEEAFLRRRFGAVYEKWAARTPAIIPNFGLWRPPSLDFSLRTAVRREYVTAYAVVAIMTLLETAEEFLGERETLQSWLRDEPFWLWFFAGGTALFFAVRLVKKRTSWLSAPGR
jgi:protein-S-isoprenylcysteine O-methyltransferase Ste14